MKKTKEKIYELILNNIYKSIKDDCLFLYHTTDKEKDEYGTQKSVIYEHKLSKIDTKMLKDIVDVVNNIDNKSKEGQNINQIILQNTIDEKEKNGN